MAPNNTGIIFDIKKYAVHDGPGIRTTVFFKGCPMLCWWCHNPESRDKNPQTVEKIIKREGREPITEQTQIGRKVNVDEVMDEIRKDVIFYDDSAGGVTFSGGEPLVQPEFLSSLLKACKREGIHTAVDTSGHVESKFISNIIEDTDLFLYDLKIMDNDEHRKYAGTSNKKVHNNFKLIVDAGKKVYIRIPVIPGITDTEENIKSMIKYIKSFNSIKEINLLPYHKIGSHKYHRLGMKYKMDGVEKPSKEQMNRVQRQFEKSGYIVTIGG